VNTVLDQLQCLSALGQPIAELETKVYCLEKGASLSELNRLAIGHLFNVCATSDVIINNKFH
jgi:hypothetical protein